MGLGTGIQKYPTFVDVFSLNLFSKNYGAKLFILLNESLYVTKSSCRIMKHSIFRKKILGCFNYLNTNGVCVVMRRPL